MVWLSDEPLTSWREDLRYGWAWVIALCVFVVLGVIGGLVK